jgi:hypothetical protein
VNETSWAYVWRLRSHYLGTGNDNGASASNFKLIGRLARAMWVHSLNAACRTCTRASTAIEGDTAVTLMGQGRRSSNAVCPTCSNHCPSKHRMIFLGTPPRSYVVSPPTTPPAMTRPNFIRPHAVGRRSQAMARMRRPVSPSMTSRRAPSVARRGRSNILSELQPRSTMTASTKRKQVAPTWGMS